MKNLRFFLTLCVSMDSHFEMCIFKRKKKNKREMRTLTNLGEIHELSADKNKTEAMRLVIPRHLKDNIKLPI